MSDTIRVSDEEALRFHSAGKPGKIEITPTKPLTTQRDLTLAYSPGVAVPCLAIEKTPRMPMNTRHAATWWRSSAMAPPCSGSAI